VCQLLGSSTRAFISFFAKGLRGSETNFGSSLQPLRDISHISHEEFPSLLGPLFVPGRYLSLEMPLGFPPSLRLHLSPVSSAPFEWIHFKEQPVKMTLNNLQGVDSLARNQRWRSQCVFRIEVRCPVKQGIEVVRVFPSLQVERAELTSREGTAHPPRPRGLPQPNLCKRTTSFSVCTHASCVTTRAIHRLLGAAALSVPTREYFPYLGWTMPPHPWVPPLHPSPPPPHPIRPTRRAHE
jgi:hypothetical protein